MWGNTYDPVSRVIGKLLPNVVSSFCMVFDTNMLKFNKLYSGLANCVSKMVDFSSLGIIRFV